MYKYNSRIHKTPFGAVREGEKVKIVFPVTHSVWVESIKMFLRKGEVVTEHPLSFCGDDGSITYFCCEFALEEWGIYYYRFEVTAVGGGVLRDLLAQRMPTVLHADVYAVAAIVGSLIVCIAAKYHGDMQIASWLGFLAVVVLRFFALRYHWQIYHPRPGKKKITP